MVKNLNKGKKLVLIFIAVTVAIVGILAWKNWKLKSGDDLTKYDYVVSFCSRYHDGNKDMQTKIVFASSNEEQLEFSDKGNFLCRLFQEGNTFRVYSVGGSKSLLFESSSGYSTHSLKKPLFASEKYYAKFAMNGKNGRIEVMGIDDGMVGVVRNIIRYTNPNHKECLSPVDDTSIYHGVEIGTKLYFTGYDMVSDRYKLCYLDEETNEMHGVDKWYSTSVEFKDLLYVNGKIITVENPYANHFIKEEDLPKNASLSSIDPATLKLKSIPLDSKKIIASYVFENHIRVVTVDNQLLEYTSDLELISETDLSGTEFVQLFSNADQKLHRIRTLGNKVAAIVTEKNTTATVLGTILEFDADTLSLQKSITIPLSGYTEWESDYVDLLIVEKP